MLKNKKTHFIRFKRDKDEPFVWKCSENDFNKTMTAINAYAPMIDLRKDLGQVFTFKDFDGSGKFPKPERPLALPEPDITDEQRKARAKKYEEWRKKYPWIKNKEEVAAQEAKEEEERNLQIKQNFNKDL